MKEHYTIITNLITDDKLDEAQMYIKNALSNNILDYYLYYMLSLVYNKKEQYEKEYLCLEQAEYLCNDSYKNEMHRLKNLCKEKYNIKVNKVSIIILTYNNIEYTKQCIESLRNNTNPENYDIIVVDNASNDNTKEWLSKQEDIRCIFNSENKGFPVGCNQGIKASEKDRDIFLLNNDTIIMPCSIFTLRLGLYESKDIGAVGAVCNTDSFDQKYQVGNYNECVEYSYINNIPDENRMQQTLKLIGFAMLIKREVLHKTGLLDEQFTPGNYEDDDISVRIVQKGYRLFVCKNSFIFHYFNATFSSLEDAKNVFLNIMQRNKKNFCTKWSVFLLEYLKKHEHMNKILPIGNMDKVNVLGIGNICGETFLQFKNEIKNADFFCVVENESIYSVINRVFCTSLLKNMHNEFRDKQSFFDYVMVNDIHENSLSPIEIINNVTPYLKENGRIIIALDNIRYFERYALLLLGDGVNEYNPVRFYTKQDMISLFDDTRFSIEKIDLATKQPNNSEKEVIDSLLEISNKMEYNDYVTYKYIFTIVKERIYK